MKVLPCPCPSRELATCTKPPRSLFPTGALWVWVTGRAECPYLPRLGVAGQQEYTAVGHVCLSYLLSESKGTLRCTAARVERGSCRLVPTCNCYRRAWDSFIPSLRYVIQVDVILLKAFYRGKLNTTNCWTFYQRPLRSQQPQNVKDAINFCLKPCSYFLK